ncbi:MAG: helix-turn-helix domain-containing protein [Deltaproteobacteria bacterium]|nr:helix-turn-helix domain-containing protein [Deltaproteobacteria bacterium]
MDDLLTTHQAADKAGVGPTAIKRWADQGLLPCVRTAGGHRRFRAQDLAAFLAQQQSTSQREFDARDDWLALLTSSASVQEIEGALLALRGRHGAWYRAAPEVGRVLVEMGERWSRNELSIIDEHLASERLQRAISRIVETIPVAAGGPAVVLTTARGDDHLLGLALVELCCRERGLRTRWTGRATPVEELTHLLERPGTQLLAVSASQVCHEAEPLEAWLSIVGPVCKRNGVDLILGGEGAWPDVPNYGLRLRNFEELNAFLRGREARRGSGV